MTRPASKEKVLLSELTGGERAAMLAYAVLCIPLPLVGVALMVVGTGAIRVIGIALLLLGIAAVAFPITPILTARVERRRRFAEDPG